MEWYGVDIRIKETKNILINMLKEHDILYEISDGRMWTGNPMVWHFEIKCDENTCEWINDFLGGR